MVNVEGITNVYAYLSDVQGITHNPIYYIVTSSGKLVRWDVTYKSIHDERHPIVKPMEVNERIREGSLVPVTLQFALSDTEEEMPS